MAERKRNQEMIESIGKAVTGALSSVLSKMKPPGPNDDDDFVQPKRRR